MTSLRELENALDTGKEKQYSLADARRIADALNLRWGRFGVEQFTPAAVDGEENGGEGAQGEGEAPAEGGA